MARTFPSLALALLSLTALQLLAAEPSRTMPPRVEAGRVEPGVDASRGALELTIPIPTPAGTGGFSPDLALTYSSSGADGPFGIGWSLRLGEIRRTTRFGIPAYDASDRFELDGELLVAGESAGRYHTNTESFARILWKSDGSWEVTRPDGTIARFGTSEETRIRKGGDGPVFRWLLAELADVNGNVVEFHYDRATDVGTAYPTEIAYTYRNGSPVGELRRIEFLYESRPDPLHLFTGAVERRVTQRVREIRSTAGASAFRRLLLRYNEGSYSTGSSRLTSTRLFGADCPTSETDPAANCDGLPAETFDYTDPNEALGTTGTSIQWSTGSSGWHPPVPLARETDEFTQDLGVRLGDVDGDGRPDLVRAFETEAGDPLLEVYRNTGDGWVLDSGWSDALAAVSFENKRLHAQTSSSGDVTDVVIDQSVSSPLYFATGRDWTDPVASGHRYLPPVDGDLVDLNGDGRADLVASTIIGAASIDCASGSCTEKSGIHVREVWLNDGSGWTRSSELSSTLPPFRSFYVYESQDDAIEEGEAEGLNYVVLRTGSEGNRAVLHRYTASPRFPDLNGDRHADVVTGSDDSAVDPPSLGGQRAQAGLKRAAWLHSDTGWVAEPLLAPPLPFVSPHSSCLWECPAAPNHAISDTGVRFADVNGDGLSDLVKRSDDGDSVFTSDELSENGVWLNHGDGWCGPANCSTDQYLPPHSFVRFEDDSNPLEIVSNALRFSDLTGDGWVDLYRADGSVSDGLRAWLHDPSVGSSPGTSARWLEDDRFAPPAGAELQAGDSFDPRGRGVAVVDADASGTIDFLQALETSSGSLQELAELSQSAHADRVRGHTNGRGGAWSYTYAGPATQQTSSLESLAEADAADLGEPEAADLQRRWPKAPVLASLTREGVGTGPFTTTYRYALPRWCDDTRTQAGYRLVEETRPDGSLRRRFYWQKHGRAGDRSRDEVLSGGGERLRVSTFDWEVVDGSTVEGSAPGVHVGRVVERSRHREYGGSPGATRTTSFRYNDNHGYNFVNRVDLERPTGASTLYRFPRAADTARWIVRLPAQEEFVAGGVTHARSTFEYNQRGLRTRRERLERLRGEGGDDTLVDTWDYDVHGNRIRHTDPAGRVEEFCYDGDSAFSSGASCPTASTATHTHRVGQLDPLGELTSFTRDLATGQVLTVTLWSGDVRTNVRGPYGRVEEVRFDPVGDEPEVTVRTASFTDAPTGENTGPHVERFRMTGDGTSVRSATYFDGLGRVARRVSEAPEGPAGRAFVRDYTGRPLRRTLPAGCGGDPDCAALTGEESPAVATSFDALGRPTLRTTPEGTSAFRYRAVTRSQPTGLGADVADPTFDAVLEKDGSGRLTERLVDGDRVVFVDECANTVSPATTDLSGTSCGSPETTFYTYEGTGEISEIHDAVAMADSTAFDTPRHRFRFEWDTVGRMRSVEDPDAGTRSFAYHPAGELATVVNARGQTTSYDVDALGRRKLIDRPEGERDVTIDYDPRTRQRSTITETDGYSETRSYDPLGRLERRERDVAGSTYLLDFDRDRLGNLRHVVYPEGTVVAYERTAGRIERVCEVAEVGLGCDDSSAVPHVTGVDHDAAGRPLQVQQNPGTLDLGYTAASRVDTLTFTDEGGSVPLDLDYDYDPAGRVKQVTDADDVTSADASADYTYDARGRLDSRTQLGETVYFSYDALGNLTGRDVDSPGETNQVYAHSEKPHAITEVEAPDGTVAIDFAYDADGNVTERGDRHLYHDSANRLRCVGTSAGACDVAGFDYDVDGERILSETQDGVRVLAGPWFEHDRGAGVMAVHVRGFGRRIATVRRTGASLRSAALLPPGWAPGLPVPPGALAGLLGGLAFGALGWAAARAGVPAAVRARPVASAAAAVLSATLVPAVPVRAGGGGGSSTVRRWYVMDRLGSSLLVVAPSGAVASKRVFEPYGEVIDEASSEDVPRLFTGQRHQAETGFYDYGARWYDPVVGRFLAVDPARPRPGEPQQHNRYGYVRNDPVNLTDPSGQSAAQGPLGFIGINIARWEPWKLTNFARIRSNFIQARFEGRDAGFSKTSVSNARAARGVADASSGDSGGGSGGDTNGDGGGDDGSSGGNGLLGVSDGLGSAGGLSTAELQALRSQIQDAIRSGLDSAAGAAVFARAVQGSVGSTVSTQEVAIAVSVTSAGATTATAGMLALGAIAVGPAVGLVAAPFAVVVVVGGIGLTAVGVESTLQQINARTGSSLSINSIFGSNLVPSLPSRSTSPGRQVER